MTKRTMLERAKDNPGLRFFPVDEEGTIKDADAVMEWLHDISAPGEPADPAKVIGTVDTFKPCSLGELLDASEGDELSRMQERLVDLGWGEPPADCNVKMTGAAAGYVKALWSIHGFFIYDAKASITAGELASWRSRR